MGYIRQYDSGVNWENSPSTATPLNETNLNQMDEAIENIDAEAYRAFRELEREFQQAMEGHLDISDIRMAFGVIGSDTTGSLLVNELELDIEVNFDVSDQPILLFRFGAMTQTTWTTSGNISLDVNDLGAFPVYKDGVQLTTSTFTINLNKVYAVSLVRVSSSYRWILTEIGSGSGGSVTVDPALSTTSENPVQNKVITNFIRDGYYMRCKVCTATTSSSRISSGMSITDNYTGLLGLVVSVDAAAPSNQWGLSFTVNGAIVIYSMLDANGNNFAASLTKGDMLIVSVDSSNFTATVLKVVKDGGSSITIDSAMSTSSENPVQNKVITGTIRDGYYMRSKTCTADTANSSITSGLKLTTNYNGLLALVVRADATAPASQWSMSFSINGTTVSYGMQDASGNNFADALTKGDMLVIQIDSLNLLAKVLKVIKDGGSSATIPKYEIGIIGSETTVSQITNPALSLTVDFDFDKNSNQYVLFRKGESAWVNWATSSDITLNVNNTGDFPVKKSGVTLTTSNWDFPGGIVYVAQICKRTSSYPVQVNYYWNLYEIPAELSATGETHIYAGDMEWVVNGEKATFSYTGTGTAGWTISGEKATFTPDT